jgi:hypothetical protein
MIEAPLIRKACVRGLLKLIPLVVAACAATPLVNVVNPRADYDADAWACTQEAARYAQLVRSNQAAPQSNQTQTSCLVNGRYVNCTSTSTPSPNLAQAFESGYNVGAEDRAFEACIRAKGWRRGR